MSKIMNLTDAVREIPNGAEIAIGGFAITRSPIAFICELIRQGKKELNVYQSIVCMATDMLVGVGAVKKLSYGGGSLDRFGRMERINEAFEKGTIDAREFSCLSLTYRFLASSLGIPYIPTKVLLGTDILENLIKKNDESVMMSTSPYGNKGVLRHIENETIRNVLKETNGNRTLAAEKLGISVTTLWRRLKKMEEEESKNQ